MDLEVESFVRAATGASAVRPVERVQTLWGGYGELVRLRLEGGASGTVILKDVAPPRAGGDDARSHARKCRSYDVELAFYRDWASRTDEHCRVARPLAVERRGARWLLLFEDLDAAGFPLRKGRYAKELRPCLAWLAAFHARFAGERPEGLWETGTYWHLATRPDELARTADAELRRAAPLLDRALEGARFRTLVHGDAKPANFCFSKDGRVAAVDFQYVGGGVGVRDFAYLLHGSVTEREEDELLDSYFGELSRALPKTIDGRALEEEWRRLYPVAKADFVRFLAGWAPGSYERDAEGRALVRRLLTQL